ncbi:MAG: hypothetical protein HQM06_16015 [Magnetococcales bacterium]|nr:hypothetical protein [Magnetococcales bacterium]
MRSKVNKSRSGKRRACYIGHPDPLRELLEQALTTAGYEMVAPGAAPSCHLVIDNGSRSVSRLRATLSVFSGAVEHYILISSHQVYPTSAPLRPWQESDVTLNHDLASAMAPATLAARALERELRLLAKDRFPYTILRPALIEGDETEGVDVTRWFVDRIVDGGVVVLPEGDLPNYRHLSAADLSRAILTVAGYPDCFGQTLNVANQATLSYWGHAAMVRDALGATLRFGYLPQWRWRAANLQLPLGERASSSLIEPSHLLLQLGWQADDPLELVHKRARECAASRRPYDQHLVARERRALAEAEAESLYHPGRSHQPLPQHATRQWVLRGWAGQPAGLSLERLPQVQNFPPPVVKVQALTLLPAEERFLRGEYPQQGHRAFGHNALLEVVNPGPHPIEAGTLAVPMSLTPCAEATTCPFCRGGMRAVLGIGTDGYGWGICSTPLSHLAIVPPSLGKMALLADPLGSLITGLEQRLRQSQAPVWIAGRTVEAALVAWLAQDAGRPVVHVDRRAADHPEFPVQAVASLLTRCREGQMPAPTLAVDFTGCADVSWPLGQALAEGGDLYVRRRPPGIPHGIHWHELSAVTPNLATLQEAVTRLQRWQSFRNLQQRLGPAIPLDLYWDALLPSPFALPYLEADR